MPIPESSIEAELIFSTGPTVDLKRIQSGIDLQKQLESQPDPIAELFGPYFEVNRGQSSGTYVSKTTIGDTVEMNDLFKKCSAGQNMLFKSGEHYEK